MHTKNMANSSFQIFKKKQFPLYRRPVNMVDQGSKGALRGTLCVLAMMCLLGVSLGQCSEPTGYTFSKTMLSDSYRLFWTINDTDSSINIAFEAKTVGWIGVGISKSDPPAMVGAEAVLGVPGSTQINSFRLGAKDSSQFYPINSLVPLRRTTICTYQRGGSTWTLGVFTRSLSSGSNPISLTGFVPFVIAYGSSNALTEHASNAREGFTLNLVTGELKQSSDSATTTTLRTVHGALMVAGFGVLLPVGLIIARFTKKLFGDSWFLIHMIVQMCGYFFGFAAFVIALYMVDDNNHFDTKAHAQLGLTVMVAGIVQLALGFFRPTHVEKGQPKPWPRLLWEILHKFLGRIVIIIAVITIFFGLYEISAHTGFYIGYAVWVGLVLIVIIVLQIIKCVKKRRDKRKPLAHDHHDDL